MSALCRGGIILMARMTIAMIVAVVTVASVQTFAAKAPKPPACTAAFSAADPQRTDSRIYVKLMQTAYDRQGLSLQDLPSLLTALQKGESPNPIASHGIKSEMTGLKTAVDKLIRAGQLDTAWIATELSGWAETQQGIELDKIGIRNITRPVFSPRVVHVHDNDAAGRSDDVPVIWTRGPRGELLVGRELPKAPSATKLRYVNVESFQEISFDQNEDEIIIPVYTYEGHELVLRAFKEPKNFISRLSRFFSASRRFVMELVNRTTGEVLLKPEKPWYFDFGHHYKVFKTAHGGSVLTIVNFDFAKKNSNSATTTLRFIDLEKPTRLQTLRLNGSFYLIDTELSTDIRGEKYLHLLSNNSSDPIYHFIRISDGQITSLQNAPEDIQRAESFWSLSGELRFLYSKGHPYQWSIADSTNQELISKNFGHTASFHKSLYRFADGHPYGLFIGRRYENGTTIEALDILDLENLTIIFSTRVPDLSVHNGATLFESLHGGRQVAFAFPGFVRICSWEKKSPCFDIKTQGRARRIHYVRPTPTTERLVLETYPMTFIDLNVDAPQAEVAR